MSIPTLDSTVGGANANSYVTLQNAEDFFDAQLNSDAWTNATSDHKNRALLMAARRLQVENWLGDRVTTTQRLAWPRFGVAKIDPVGVGWGWGYGYGYGYPTDVYLTTEIPQPVKDAQCELALAYLEGFDDGEEDAVDSFSADNVSLKFRPSRPSGSFPPRVMQLIGALIAGKQLVRA